MITEYKIEKSKIFEPIKKSKWFYIFLTFGLLINLYIFGLIALLIVFALFGILIIFQMILHFQYYQHDKKIKLTIDYENRIVNFYNSSADSEIRFDDIQLIQRFKGSKYANPSDIYVIPSNFYNWTRIQTKDGFSYSFSCFIKDDLNIYGIQKHEKIIQFLNLIKY